jgi:hypothetical protein
MIFITLLAFNSLALARYRSKILLMKSLLYQWHKHAFAYNKGSFIELICK